MTNERQDRSEGTSQHKPGAIIGYRADGRPIHLIAGGAEDEQPPEQGDAEGSGAADESNQDGASDDSGESGQSGEQADNDGGKTEAEIKRARQEAAQRRTELRETKKERDTLKSTLDQLRKALDGDSGDGDDDPQKVAEKAIKERDETAQRLREKDVELAVRRQAKNVGADPDALLDSRGFMKATGDLDPNSDSFATDLESAMKKAVEDNNKLRLGQAPARSGGEFTGGTGNSEPKFTRAQIKAMSPGEYRKNESAILEAMAAGRVTNS